MNQQEKEISKFLSLILRHKPNAIGITLDEHGWANVNELLDGMNQTTTLDLNLLKKIVREDEKQRYSFNSDETLIRANQGHSVPVDVELEKKHPPEFLWHGTGKKYSDSINIQGLIHKSRLYVHLSNDCDTAYKVGSRHGEAIVYKVAAEEMDRDGYDFYLSANGVWLTKHVPVKYLGIASK